MVRGESSALRLVTGVVLFGGMGGEGLAGTRLVPPCASSANIAGWLLRLIGLGGGIGGCLVGWAGTLPIEDGAEEAVRGVLLEACVLAPAEDTFRSGFPAVLTAEEEEEELEEEEEKADAGLLAGVRGKLSAPGSAVEVISHFGGMTDCLGGRGSRSVSLKPSEFGMY